jgi:cytochrome c oxidase subunit 1
VANSNSNQFRVDATTPVVEAIDVLAEGQQGQPPLTMIYEWVTSVDHKKIGLMYIAYALFFLVVGGFEAILMRIQLAVPNNHFLSPQVFNQLFTMHGTTMVFFVGMAILFGMGNYLVPLEFLTKPFDNAVLLHHVRAHSGELSLSTSAYA